jgi:hypothetical protein
MIRFLLLLLSLPVLALSQGSTNDYMLSQKPASGPLLVRPVTPAVGRLLGWPSSINTPAAITLGTGLSLSGSTLNATASSAWGDLTGIPAAITTLSSATAAGLALMDDADASAQRTTLGLGTLATQSGTFSGTSSGTNTGDNAVNSNYSGLVTNATHTGDATGATALTLATVNTDVGSFGSATAAPAVTVNAKGLVTAVTTNTITPAVSSITGLGTGIATALAINSGTAGAPVLLNGALGTPSSGVVTNLTGTASININGTVGATTPNTGAFNSVVINGASLTAEIPNFATTSSATNYLGVKTTGTGADIAAGIFMANSTSHGLLYKAGTGYGTYKNITSNDLGFYNNNIGGNISILNDHTSGNINFAAGGSSTAHLTIASTGVVNVANLTTNGVVTATSGTGTLATVAPGSNGNVLTSNGTTWTSAAPAAAGATLAANTFTGLQQFSGTTHAGIRLNNLTTAERDALSSPAAGMAIWNTTDGRLQLHNGSAWTSGMVRLSGDTMTGALTVGLSGLGTTPTAALSLTNSTAAAAGAQQVSPSLVLEGQGWKTTATAASQTVRFRQNVLPIQGAANPTGGWRLQSEINNSGTWADRLTVRTDGIDIANDYRIGLLADAIGISFRNYSSTSAIYFSIASTSVLNLGSSQMSTVFNGFTVTQTNAANDVLQLGANTSTASATAVAQTLKGPNATGTTSTGGSLTIAGGTGTSAGGAVIISTAATTTQTERARFSSAGVTIGASGTAIASVISATATLDFASTAAHECSVSNITVTGAAVGDVVAIGIPPDAIGTSGVFFGYVSATDTVSIRYHNTDKNNAVDPASGTFRATVIKH